MDVNAILNSVLGSKSQKVSQYLDSSQRTFGEGLAGGAAVGGLAALLLSSKKSRKIVGNVATYGGLAAVGGLAYKVWKDRQNAPTSAADTAPMTQTVNTASEPASLPTPPSGSIFDLADSQPDQPEDTRLILLRAMISAAKSDGHIDQDERTRIEQQIEALQIGTEEQQYLLQQIKAASDPIAIARLSTSDELALEIYAASLLAVDVDTPEERRYLDRLADALHLSDELKTAMEAETAAYQG